jgi:hypothetical protein
MQARRRESPLPGVNNGAPKIVEVSELGMPPKGAAKKGTILAEKKENH